MERHEIYYFWCSAPDTVSIIYIPQWWLARHWWCLAPLSTIFQLYRGGQVYWRDINIKNQTLTTYIGFDYIRNTLGVLQETGAANPLRAHVFLFV